MEPKESNIEAADIVSAIMLSIIMALGSFLIPETVLLLHTVSLLAYSIDDVGRAIAARVVFAIFADPDLLAFVFSITCPARTPPIQYSSSEINS